MMYFTLLLGILKTLWMAFQLWQHRRGLKRDKALVDSLEAINQRLKSLEDFNKKLKP